MSPESDEITSGKRQRCITTLRAKRIRRNKNKKLELRGLTRKQIQTKLLERLSKDHQEQIQKKVEEQSSLMQKLETCEHDFLKEKRMSAYFWRKWKEVHARMDDLSKSGARMIDRKNLHETGNKTVELGKGCFGRCFKMDYRGIKVAVKHFENHVQASAVQAEASILSQIDHPGLPLLFGTCTGQSPFLLVSQFHGVDGQCMTLNNAAKTHLLDGMQEWARIFKESADALAFLHSKDILHNDIKGDNVIICSEFGFHPVLIDFGKARKLCDAKRYSLTKREQRLYQKHHWHIAPELIRGTSTQSFASDVFSYGVLLRSICKWRRLSKLLSVAAKCIHSNPHNRPKFAVVCELLSL